MLSMTGFASATAPLGDGQVVIEIRSLNHRFLEVRVRLPPEIQEQSFFMEQLARERLKRGRYDIGVRLEGAALPPPALDAERARATYRSLAALRDELAPGTELPITVLASLAEVVAPRPSAAPDALRHSLGHALDDALRALDEMRCREGEALQSELLARLTTAREHRSAIAARSEDVVHQTRARLTERLSRLLSDVGVPLDAGRLENELAILADRGDITEELARLASHFDQFEQLLDATEPVGRRLDFLLQEVAREANTVGAKSQDAPLSHLVVALKAETERLREQVQNVL